LLGWYTQSDNYPVDKAYFGWSRFRALRTRRFGPLGIGDSDEFLKGIEGLLDDLSQLKERWDNRLILEKASLGDAYMSGRFEVLLYGEWPAASHDVEWACRVVSDSAIAHYGSADPDVNVGDACDGDGGDKQIMLIVVVESMEGPKLFVRPILGPYSFEKNICSSGEGDLYRCEPFGIYKVFPNMGKLIWTLG
jgi:hypothetical protein